MESPKSHEYWISWNGWLVTDASVVPVASKVTDKGATPDVRLGTRDSVMTLLDGGLPGKLVVKFQEKIAARGLPAASLAAVVMVAVYCMPATRGPDEVKVAVLPLTLTVPATGDPPVVVASLTLALLSVELFIGSEKVADTGVLGATPVAPMDGDVADTVGAVVSATAAVAKVQL